jgi:hypothetical protein
LPSQIYANQSFTSDIASVVVVETVAGLPLRVADETPHLSLIPPAHDGAVEVPAMGVLLDLHIRRYQFSPLLSVAVAVHEVVVPELLGVDVDDSYTSCAYTVHCGGVFNTVTVVVAVLVA